MIAVINAIEELTVDWLSDVIGQSVTGFQAEEIVGEGYASRMYRISVAYEDKQAAPSFILKLATGTPAQIELHEKETLFREVDFYAGPGERLTGVTPRTYFAERDEQAMQLTILMEDLGFVPHKPFKESLENSIKAMQAIAKVHAAFWDDPMLDSETYNSMESAVDFDTVISLVQESMAIEEAADYSYPYLNSIMKHTVKLAPWLISEGNFLKGNVTLIHGDFHTRNIHLVDGEIKIYDWQTAERGTPPRDVIYWILTSVDVDDQQAFRKPLINAYLQALKNCGVQGYGRKQFDQQFLDAVSPLIPRMYCYQKLIDVAEDERHLITDFLDRTELFARSMHYLGLVRMVRVLAPVVISFLRLIGKRQPGVSHR